MRKIAIIGLILVIVCSCTGPGTDHINMEALASMGSTIKSGYEEMAAGYRAQLESDPGNAEAWLGLAETNIIIYIFGFSPREATLPEAREALAHIRELKPGTSEELFLSGQLLMLDWDWAGSEAALKQSIAADPQNLQARHWYSLYLSAMGRFDEAMAQSDSIIPLDPEGNYMIGRGSLLYFARRNIELRDLMIRAVAMDTTVAWGYDWLGMAYIELKDYENSIRTYYRAFDLSDGTVEVGGGLGHALGLAGKTEEASFMATYYDKLAEDHYLPPVQRAFIHIGIGEDEKALELLEQAYAENSWFLIFMQIEPWYDPIRDDERFQKIQEDMNFPG